MFQRIKKLIKTFINKTGFLRVPNERTFLYQHLSRFAKELSGKRVLDIGAGQRQYKHLLEGQNEYQSCDLKNGFHPDEKHDILASIYSIPQRAEHYDVVLLLQVLEHLEFPAQGLKEVHRILKKDGLVFISTPQAAGDHFIPHHYFNFTQYGLQSVLNQSGFTVLEHYRLDGIFNYVGNRIDKLGSIVYNQYKKNFFFKVIGGIFMLFCRIMGYFVSLFDFIDKKRNYCIGHIVVARKVVLN